MTLSLVMSMWIFAAVGAVSPGPVNIIAATSGANFGWWRTLPFVLGATLAYTLIVMLAGLGVSAFLGRYPQVLAGLNYLGAGFLLYMAFKLASARPDALKTSSLLSAPPGFMAGVLAQVLNPKAWLVAMAGVSLFVSTVSVTLFLGVFCAVSLMMCFAGISSWAAMGRWIGRVLSVTCHQVMFNRIMGLLLVVMVLVMLFAGGENG